MPLAAVAVRLVVVLAVRGAAAAASAAGSAGAGGASGAGTCSYSPAASGLIEERCSIRRGSAGAQAAVRAGVLLLRSEFGSQVTEGHQDKRWKAQLLVFAEPLVAQRPTGLQ